MTKQEAVIALMQGKRVIHREGDQRLSAGMHDGAFKILGEGWDNACEYTLSDMFEDGYEIVEPEKTREQKAVEVITSRYTFTDFAFCEDKVCIQLRDISARNTLIFQKDLVAIGYEPQNIIFIGG